VPQPEPGHHQDDAEVLQQERDPDRQVLDGVEVRQVAGQQRKVLLRIMVILQCNPDLLQLVRVALLSRTKHMKP
jgi:hypothetical protein